MERLKFLSKVGNAWVGLSDRLIRHAWSFPTRFPLKCRGLPKELIIGHETPIIDNYLAFSFTYYS
jgi:hypothetical protein